MAALTPEEMLAVVYDRTERIENLLLGNGQEGLVTRVAKMERGGAKRGGIAAAIATVFGTASAVAFKLLSA